MVILALLYSIGAHGIMTLNDFKSVDGDKKSGVASLPVQLGVSRAAKLACYVMAVPQMIVCLLLLHWDHLYYAIAVAVLIAAQGALMPRLLVDPRGQASWYNATGTTLYVLGMLVAAVSLRGGMEAAP